MDMQWMKRIDRLAGLPLCGALKLIDLAVAPGPQQREQDLKALSEKATGQTGRRPRIAVVKFWGMGSLILAAPMFQALRHAHPGAEICLITLGQNRGIVELLDIADRVHFLELPPSPAAVAWRILGFFAGLKSLELDAVIDLEYLSRFSAVVSYLTGAPVRVGFHSWDVWRGDLQTVRKSFNPYWHATDNFINLHRGLGVDGGGTGPVRLKLSGTEQEAADALLASAGVGREERLIAINVNSSTVALARRWPEASFVELIDRTVEAGWGRVALLGAPEEAAYVSGLQKRTRRPERIANLAGRSSLRDLVGILERADLLVTNDSGPLHLADALGTKTVSFFGPETPQLFGPRGPGHLTLYRGIDCSPCINIYNAKTVRCVRAEPECLTGITVEEALAAVKQSLGEG